MVALHISERAFQAQVERVARPGPRRGAIAVRIERLIEMR